MYEIIGDDVIGIDLKFNPDSSVERELFALAQGIAALYREATAKWPGQTLWPSQKVDGNIFSFELRPLPDLTKVKW